MTVRNDNGKTSEDSDLTQLLHAWSAGDARALDQLTPLVHAELYRIARRYMASERPDHTLQASALINEAYIRLVDWKAAHWKDRCHFFAAGAQIMRRILVDHARARYSDKRQAAAQRVTLNTALLGEKRKSMDLVALDDALARLSDFDPRKSQVVELRIFGGLSIEETAEAMNVANITVRRDWKFALAWLRNELESTST